MEPTEESLELNEVLAELHFPAEKWDVISCAEIWGVDLELRRRLYALPVRTFENEREVAESL
jgi:Protein of unknown function (DUF2795)